MPAGLNAQGSGIPMSDAMGSFKRRKRKSIIVTVMLLIVSILILVFGLAATTRTQNITVGGYYPGVILGFGSFLGIIGAHLIENKRQMLVASIVFISFGVVAAFCCAIVDGVFAARHIDLRPVYAGRCEYYSSGTAFDLDVHCQTASRVSCNLRVKSNTCYCCDLYNCGKYVCVTESNLDTSLLENFLPTSGFIKKQQLLCFTWLSSGLYLLVWCVLLSLIFSSVRKNICVYLCFREHPLMGLQNKDVLKKFRKSSMIWNRVELRGGYHEYTEVRSCQDVVHLYHLLWSATILNIVALFLGIITAAVLGGFKDMMPTAAPDSCEPEPLPIPPPRENPGPTTSINSFYNTAPRLPPYTAYDLQGASLFPDSSGLSDDSQSGASHIWPNMIPPRYSPPYYPPDEKPPPYSP
ncbi:transmembrane protein 255A isoform X1 [Pimephales promelas]|uniref:transmembrane protein 255A isoform X1 n=1 Tax=Pimephales promelas TaxID=90988 RepID=UPI001955D68C|nr:transmembrane protein 255A isoform X1 [Pimephales promelas]KAG1954541.1 transmembrane protein 255A [Pimephales promelas]